MPKKNYISVLDNPKPLEIKPRKTNIQGFHAC